MARIRRRLGFRAVLLPQADQSLQRSRLEVAWTYPTGDGRKYSFNPIVVDGVLFVLAKNNSIVAIDAATGKEIWTYTPDPPASIITNRGINYWESKDRTDRRLLFAANHMLQAIDARTGKPIPTFRHERPRRSERRPGPRSQDASPWSNPRLPDASSKTCSSSAPRPIRDTGPAPGDIRAFDVRTGKARLDLPHHSASRRVRLRYLAQGRLENRRRRQCLERVLARREARHRLRPHRQRQIQLLRRRPQGRRTSSATACSRSTPAPASASGTSRWSTTTSGITTTPPPPSSSPSATTARPIDAVAQVSKQGFVWVFNRVTGEPLWPIEERPVPRSDMPGEEAWPTQPFPTRPPPFARQKFTADDLNPYLSAEDRARFRDEILSARNEGLFTPPGLRNTIQMPGNNGGANWGGAAVEPDKGTLFVVSKDLPAILKLVPDKDRAGRRRPLHQRLRPGDRHQRALSDRRRLGPRLTAYDLNEGTIKWKVSLGEVPELAAKGIKDTGSHYPKVGPVVTAGGLIFTGTRDRKIRALDVETGKALWETQVDAALEGIPAVYEIRGREYIVFCAAAQAGLTQSTQEKIAGAYVAFALPAK